MKNTERNVPSSSSWVRSSLLAPALALLAACGTAGDPGNAKYAATAPCVPGSAPVNLGAAADYSIFVFGDYTGGKDVALRIAAMGDVAMAVGFNAGNMLTAAGDAIVAGGSLALVSGTVHGNAWYGPAGSATVDSVGFNFGGQVQQASNIDARVNFTAALAGLTKLSTDAAAVAPNGQTEIAWGNVTFTGTDGTINVFTIDIADLAAANSVQISAPAGSVAVVNVVGASGTLDYFGISLQGGIAASHVLWNFSGATSLTIAGVGWLGSILAPHAAVSYSNGQMHGTIVAGSLEGDVEMHAPGFLGTIPACGGGGGGGGGDPIIIGALLPRAAAATRA